MKTIVTILLLFAINTAIAQSNINDSPQQKNTDYGWAWEKTNNTFTPPPPNPVPIDGGIGFLLVAGLGYGIRQIKKSSNKL